MRIEDKAVRTTHHRVAHMVRTEMYVETSLRPPNWERAWQVGGNWDGMGTGTYLESQHLGD